MSRPLQKSGELVVVDRFKGVHLDQGKINGKVSVQKIVIDSLIDSFAQSKIADVHQRNWMQSPIALFDL